MFCEGWDDEVIVTELRDGKEGCTVTGSKVTDCDDKEGCNKQATGTEIRGWGVTEGCND